MSDDPHGILAYGYDLGGPDNWKLDQPKANEYGYISEDKFWFMNPIPSLVGEDSWSRRALAYLTMELTGFQYIPWSEKEERPPDYYKKLNKAESGLGLEIVRYGTWDYSGYILATTVFKTDDYGAMQVAPDLIDHSAADRLYRALVTLKIWPKQTEPRWILASFYG